jgi:hypothetical protein
LLQPKGNSRREALPVAGIAKSTQRYRAQDLGRFAGSDKTRPPNVERGLIVASLLAARLPFIRLHQLGAVDGRDRLSA